MRTYCLITPIYSIFALIRNYIVCIEPMCNIVNSLHYMHFNQL